MGLGVIVLCLTAGSAAAQWSRSAIFGNVLWLIVLLLLLWLRIVPTTLVRGASSALLSVLPILFVPLYVQPFSDKAFWLLYGPTLLPVVTVGCAATIVLAVAVAMAISIAHGAGLREHLALVGVMMSGMFGMVLGPLLLSWFGSRGKF